MTNFPPSIVGRHGPDSKQASRGMLQVVRVSLLGRFEVSIGPRVVEKNEWRLRKAAALIKVLALAPGHRLHREQVIDRLWPNLTSRTANNLHQALHVARRVLEPKASTSSYLRFEDARLVLCPNSPLWVDVEAFTDAAVTARHSRDPAAYRAAIDLYAGELLPDDRYEEWVEERREGLRLWRLTLLVELAGLYEEHGELEPAIEALQRVVASETTHEEAHASLMRLYARTGQRRQALWQYEQFRQDLDLKLGAEPGAQIRRLREQIVTARTVESPPAGSPPEKLPDAHNLPISLTSFIGREHEVLEIKRQLSMTRLLTLTGAGGSGKTRLALKVATDLIGAYPDGVWISELAPLSEGALVPQTVAGALGVYEQPNRPLIETLVEAIGARRMLLMLDNCEHLVDACAHLAQTLLLSCPRLRVLATSREALGVAGEANRRVPSLSLPDPEQPPTVEELEGYESVRLFVERALYRPSTFVLSPRNVEVVADICRKLDGIPLAIELAAARVGTLAVEQISERLGDSLKLLKSSNRTATPRQQTLQGALDWGYDLLSLPEKRLFGRLSVFSGGWTLEAAEAVGTGESVEEGDVLDLLAWLVDKSLVAAETSIPGRYRLLEFIRQHGWERLKESGEAEAVRRRHASWCLALAEAAEKELNGPDQLSWLERLERDHPNLRAALAWSLDGGDAEELGLRLAAALWPFWDTRGHLVEGRRWLESAISGSTSTTHARARALDGAGYIALTQGDYGEAKALLEEGLRLFRELEDEEGIASCLTNLGFAGMFGMRDDVPVGALMEEALALRPRIQDHRTLGNLLVFAGMILETPGDDREMALHEESLALLREARDIRGMSMCLTSLGITAMRRGNYERATTLLRENLLLSRELDKKYCISYSFFGMAGVALGQKEPARAARLWAAAESVREAAGIHLSPLARSSTSYDDYLAAARAQLGESAFEEAWAEGKAMTQKEAVEYALATEEAVSDPTPEKPSTGKQPAAITPREWEVVVLIARGMTDHQISTELSISKRTVTTHVGKILRKLRFSSRAQIAAWTAGQRLPDLN